jgi:hypothetical protein
MPQPNTNLGLLGVEHLADIADKAAIINVMADGSVVPAALVVLKQGKSVGAQELIAFSLHNGSAHA